MLAAPEPLGQGGRLYPSPRWTSALPHGGEVGSPVVARRVTGTAGTSRAAAGSSPIDSGRASLPEDPRGPRASPALDPIPAASYSHPVRERSEAAGRRARVTTAHRL